MLSFSQPWFLLGLVGLAIPVALHLINRRPARRWIFSSLRFLSPAPLPRQGRRKLSDLLLLLLRILAFAAIVFMLAGPAWLPTDPTSPKTQEKFSSLNYPQHQ
ncbi:MAG: BatA domain-containing protein [Verrucomicrobia bacterium]|nr:BatA domain-containing protein [Verrucomicrobiota bacterium]